MNRLTGTVLDHVRVVVPAAVDITSVSKHVGCKPDIVAMLLHQWAVVVVKRGAADGWVPLKAVLLRQIHRRAEQVLNGLESFGIIEVERNVRGRKSYLAGRLAKEQRKPPSSTRYRVNPALCESFNFYVVTAPTAIKAFWRNYERLAAGLSVGTPEVESDQNDQHEMHTYIYTNRHTDLTDNSIKRLSNNESGRFANDEVAAGEHQVNIRSLNSPSLFPQAPSPAPLSLPSREGGNKVGRFLETACTGRERILAIATQYDATRIFAAWQRGEITKEECSLALRLRAAPLADRDGNS